MPQQSAVILTHEERSILETFVHRGKANARTLTRARILLKSAEGWSTTELAEAFDVCRATVTNVRQRLAQGGLEAVLHGKNEKALPLATPLGLSVFFQRKSTTYHITDKFVLMQAH